MSEAPLRQIAAVPVAAADAAPASLGPRRALRASGRHAAVIALACGTLVVWSFLIITLHPGQIADEKWHFPAAVALARGQPAATADLPMPPAFHALAAAWMRLAGASLTSVRVLNTLFMLAALGVYAGAARARHGDGAATHVLLLAWNPLLLPYAVLAYTEPLSVLLLVSALWLHGRRHSAWAAAALLAACAVRQSNITWLLLFAAWSVADRLDAGRGGRDARAILRTSRHELLREIWPYGLALVLVLAVMAAHPTLFLRPSDVNRAGLNPALFFAFGFVVATVWAPLWFERLGRLWPTHVRPSLYRATPVILALAAIGLLAGLYENPHRWNGYTGFLHDRFAITLSGSAAARWAVAGLIVLLLPPLALHIRQSARPRALAAAWAISLLFLAPHSLVDHRYFIPPLIFIHFFTRYEPATARYLCAWSFVLAMATCGYTLLRGGPAAGL